MENLASVLNDGVLSHLARHLEVLNKSQEAIQKALPAALQKIVKIGNVEDGCLTLFVQNNAVSQKIHNLQVRILASVSRVAACETIAIKVAPHLFAAEYVYPKEEKRKISKAAAQKMREELQNQPEELREIFLNIIQSLEDDF